MTFRSYCVITLLIGLLGQTRICGEHARLHAAQAPVIKQGVVWDGPFTSVLAGPTRLTITAYYDVVFDADYPEEKTICVAQAPPARTKCITAGRLKAIVSAEGIAK